MTIALDKMSSRDLNALKSRIDEAIAKRAAEEKAVTRAKIEEMVAAAGFSVAEILGGRARGRLAKVVKRAPAFRNPANPAQTWTGRGRRPAWIAKSLAKGAKLDSFKVPA